MQEIIRASGLSAGAVYLYFPSKEDIILTAIRTSLDGVRSIVSEILAKDSYASLPLLTETIAAAFDRFVSQRSPNQHPCALSDGSLLPGVSRTVTGAVKSGQKRGIIDRKVSADAAASLLLSVLLGNEFNQLCSRMVQLACSSKGRRDSHRRSRAWRHSEVEDCLCLYLPKIGADSRPRR
jgi:AcrR family transcriptional regulator